MGGHVVNAFSHGSAEDAHRGSTGWNAACRACLAPEGPDRPCPVDLRFAMKYEARMIASKKELMMPSDTPSAMPSKPKGSDVRSDFFRFHAPHMHLGSLYGDDWFALKAEAFARFFGTPVFIIIQTVIVAIWVLVNIAGLASFDLYPFILLNLAFSLQAAYAAPLILLAQTRQADRDKAHAEADAEHREDIAQASAARQTAMTNQTEILVEMLNQNTLLTENIKDLTERLETLTREVHQRLLQA
jgi:uncharacterized membrane protein